MSGGVLFALAGIGLFVLGLHALILRTHPLRKVLGLNIMGSGAFLLLVAPAGMPPDPVPQAMVITGIVVAVSATALALVLTVRLRETDGER